MTKENVGIVKNMAITLAFDIYGTLIDTHGVIVELEKHIGDRAIEFSQSWRDKQLEYSFRRGLMQKYEDFSVCTNDAFEFSCSKFQVKINNRDKQTILDAYKTLPAFGDVEEGLEKTREAGYSLYAFSNGTVEAVAGLLAHAGIMDYFRGIVSVDEVKTFKPDPAVYRHFITRTGASAKNTWLVSSNPFDIIGAHACGMKTAWVQRSPKAVFDPWGVEPTITVNSLIGLSDNIVSDDNE